jgi:hypothetical protein
MQYRSAIRNILFALFIMLPFTSSAQAVYGETSLEFDQGYLFARTLASDGGAAFVLIDLACPATAVTGNVASLGRQQMRQENGDVAPARLGAALGGFGLSLPVSGESTVAQFHVGNIIFPNVPVRIVQAIPDVAGRKVVGIVGLDLLRRAEVVSLQYGNTPRMMLQSKARPGSGARVPIVLNNNVVTATGSINGTEVQFVLDTGSPESFLSPAGVRAIGASAVAGSTAKLQLTDGTTVTARSSNVRSFSIGTSGYTGVEFHIADLPVFTQASGTSALLGNSFFSGLSRVEINFAANTATFVSE